MAKKAEIGLHDTALEETLQVKEMAMERRINFFRAFVVFVILLAASLETAAVGKLHEMWPFLLPIGAIIAAYTFLVHRLTSGGAYRPWLKYVTISIDFILTLTIFAEYRSTGILAKFFAPEGQGAALILILILLNVLSVLRYSDAAIIYAGILSISGAVWAAIAVAHSIFLANHAALIALLVGALIVYYVRDIRHMFIRLSRREALTRFLPKEMVESVDRGETALTLGGAETEVTLLLTDIRGFTRLSEDMPPTALVELLNAYLTRMTEIVFEFGGTLDKFIGDAILAVFGSPVSRPDDAQRAVAAALKMLAVLAEFNRQSERRGFAPLQIGAALHTGLVVSGNIGSPQRMEYTVIGDSVNLVSRIEGLNKTYGTRLLMTEETYRRVESTFAGKLIAETTVRGRRKEVRLYGLYA